MLLESINMTVGKNRLGRTTALGLTRQRHHIDISYKLINIIKYINKFLLICTIAILLYVFCKFKIKINKIIGNLGKLNII